MTSMLPPTRDLPPGRQAQIRGELERAVAGRRVKRFVVPILAGATAVVAVATSVVLLRPDQGTAPQPAVQITTSPSPTTPPVDFGVPPETVAAIEEGCARSAGVGGKAKLHQLLREETRWALLYTDREELTCSIGVGGMEYNSGFSQTAVDWLPGHFSIDSVSASAGGDGGKPASQGVPGFRTFTGRVDAKVAKVTITVDGRTVEAKVANGTFAARVYYPPSWVISQSDPVVNFSDAAGNLVGTGADLRESCYYVPDSQKIVYSGRDVPADKCKPATPWR